MPQCFGNTYPFTYTGTEIYLIATSQATARVGVHVEVLGYIPDVVMFGVDKMAMEQVFLIVAPIPFAHCNIHHCSTLSPPGEVCHSPKHAAHYHMLGRGESYLRLTQQLAGHRQTQLIKSCIFIPNIFITNKC
jgi:hypothetical protein